MVLFLNRLWLSTLAVLLACSAFGGLQEREQDIKQRSAKKSEKKKEREENSSSGNSDIATSAFGSGSYPSSSSSYSGSFMSDFWGWLVMAPFAYRHDDPSSSINVEETGWADESPSIYPRHEPGQATAPYVRVDYNFQWADDVDAHDGRIELGYKLLAFHARMTQYTDTTDFTLDVRQYYAVLRYGGHRPDFLPGTFEFNFGLGVAHHTGDIEEEDSSGAVTFGIKYYPVEWFGMEFRPAWYRWENITIRDYDLSASVGYRYLQLRGGYRWLWDQGVVDVQSGFYTGVSVSF
jgi:hypothetical protein